MKQYMGFKAALRHKVVWLTLVTILLTQLVGVGLAQAQESANYNLTLNSWAGGNYGGATLSSASYTMVVSGGTHIKVASSSPDYSLCTGFICQSDQGFFQLRLPSLSKGND